jgi:hypothetical protein
VAGRIAAGPQIIPVRIEAASSLMKLANLQRVAARLAGVLELSGREEALRRRLAVRAFVRLSFTRSQ